METKGTGWTGVSGLLRQACRQVEEFNELSLPDVVATINARKGRAPELLTFQFDDRADELYKLIMPRLDEATGTEFRQVGGKQNGFELFRQLNRRIDPPREDINFDLRTEIAGLGSHKCKDFRQTFRFIKMLEGRRPVGTSVNVESCLS